MKRMITAAAWSAGMILLTAFAEEKPVNPFQRANEQFFRGKWATSNKWRKVKVTVSQKDGKQFFKTEPDDPAKRGGVFWPTRIEVKPGQQIQISIKISGRGKVYPAVTCHNAQKKYLRWVWKEKNLTADSQTISAVLTVPEKAAYVLPELDFSGGSEAVVEQLEYRLCDPFTPLAADAITVPPARIRAHVGEKPSEPPAGSSVDGKDGLYTLTYKFTTPKHDALFFDLDVPLNKATGLTAQVKGNGKRLHLFAVVRDKSGECFYFSGPMLNFEGWKDVEIKFDYPKINVGEKYASIWDGDGNQKPDFPLQGITIGLNDTPDSFKGQGKIQIRNIVIK